MAVWEVPSMNHVIHDAYSEIGDVERNGPVVVRYRRAERVV